MKKISCVLLFSLFFANCSTNEEVDAPLSTSTHKENNSITMRYGDTRWVPLGATIPTGWVAVDANNSIGLLIKDLNGAPSGAEQWIIPGNLPYG